MDAIFPLTASGLGTPKQDGVSSNFIGSFKSFILTCESFLLIEFIFFHKRILIFTVQTASKKAKNRDFH
jgi:hypothetical protein